jgi:hypothetical protein
MEKIYKHITITSESKIIHKQKLAYEVFNTKNKDSLGYIFYEPNWKQYVFEAEPQIIFSVSCLQDIIDFIENEIKI